MGTKLEAIEGIGPAYAAKLIQAGVSTAEDLLEKAKTAKGRDMLAQASGVAEKLILGFANKVDLTRVKGIGAEYADLLEAAGVDTVPELARRVPANLVAKLAEANEKVKRVTRLPAESEVARWVEFAKSLPRVIEH